MELRTVTYVFILVVSITYTLSIFVDTGNPYMDTPLVVGELTFKKIEDGSPLHTIAYFPLKPGDYPVIMFVGGLNGYILAEYYSAVMQDMAAHGFFIFGMDYKFPVTESNAFEGKRDSPYGQDIDIFFKQLEWLEIKMVNKTVATPIFGITGLLCHSSGCAVTAKMASMKSSLFRSTVFLEPFSFLLQESVNVSLPALMYGAQYAEDSVLKCSIPGLDYKAMYNGWRCPRIMMNVAEFGHCDILDPMPWDECHISHFCKTTNNTYLPEYRKFVQGVVSGFFITTLQGLTADYRYISQRSLIPLRLLALESDLNCTMDNY